MLLKQEGLIYMEKIIYIQNTKKNLLDSYVKNAKALISQKQNNNPNNKSTQVSKNKVKLSGSNGSNKSLNRKEIKSAYDIGDDDEGYKLWEQNFDKGMYN